MSNRHANKKLRAEVRRRMAGTGERYQRALAAVLASGPMTGAKRTPAKQRVPAAAEVDLIPLTCFEVPMTLFTVSQRGIQSFVLLGPRSGDTGAATYGLRALRFLQRKGIQ